jgi:hypothetical protein
VGAAATAIRSLTSVGDRVICAERALVGSHEVAVAKLCPPLCELSHIFRLRISLAS